jgi:hypothetical protein
MRMYILDRADPRRHVEVRAPAEHTADADYTLADKVGEKSGAALRRIDRPGESRAIVARHAVKFNAVDLGRR